MKTRLLLLALLLIGVTWIASAQDEQVPTTPRQRPSRHETGGPGSPVGPGGPGMRPMPGPLFAVLDANHDGVIDETEIEHAAVALKKLDKDGDGKITAKEIRPPRPEGGPRGQRGHGGPPPMDGQDGPPSDASE